MLIQPTSKDFLRPLATKTCGQAVLHVCVMISNPVRYRSRYSLLESFIAQNNGDHIKFWLVEVAYGNRPFVVTERDNRQHLQVRTESELWHKENALSLLFSHVLSEEPGAEYFAWVDADVTFARADWAYETLQQLQHYDVVQMFSQAQDVDPKHRPIGKLQQGFAWSYYNDTQGHEEGASEYDGYARRWHPGYAWAARRSALDALGGLIDWAVLGSADRHMANALIGQAEHLRGLSDRYYRKLLLWQERAERYIKRNIGYVDGLLVHHWHGRKVDRNYGNRWDVLRKNEYDPDSDLKRDMQGLWVLTDRSISLRDDIRSYFRARNEDSIDLA